MAISRNFGKERSLGDIFYNRGNKSLFANIEGGFFGRVTVTLQKNNEGGFDLLKNYTTKNGEPASFVAGKTFAVKDKDGNVIDGLTQGLLGLIKEYSVEQNKELVSNRDALKITTHKLKEPKSLGESNVLKVGYITGVFMIEKPETQNEAPKDFMSLDLDSQSFDIKDDEIPF